MKYMINWRSDMSEECQGPAQNNTQFLCMVHAQTLCVIVYAYLSIFGFILNV